ncbi:hypothetical protein D910_02591 [Dendroctonus ponderosae]|uniref:Uncharacterized protein n=1 Tax=Dendroctonus ponderosae TaxID=77166 RepID=U4TUC8_DENPD|nr:hypothetical protein D910_02591 [Dendroctonus ponderosae]
MEDNIENEAKSRSRSNSARILVFEEPRAYLEQKQRCSVGPAQESVAVLMRNQPDLQNASSNLLKFRNSVLGKSAPSLSSMKDININRRNSRPAINRLSLVANTSPILPRSHSPICGSPIDSPRTHQSFANFSFAPIKRIVAGYRGDGRRWSVASLPSSGYGTTPGSSNMSSKCSSQERLHQLPHIPTSEDIKMLTHHFSSNESNPSLPGSSYDDSCVPHRSPLHRPRSRSLSSPSRSPVIDNEICMMNVLYKERFPKATQQMEERLNNYNEENKTFDFGEDCDYLPIVRFVHHQVLEMARDCLHKSQNKLITSRYFYEMSENLERLLTETKEKSEEAAAMVTGFIKKLLLIISRPARLLECLEFDPEEFYHFLEAAEGQVKGLQGLKADIPQYIIQKLDDIEWPTNEDWSIQEEAKDLITVLLQHSPRDRLGSGGAHEVKDHGLDWNSLLRQKAEFVPQLEHDEDTSYFDSRMDRYSHEIEDDTDDTDDSPVFGLFSSCSPQYRKTHGSKLSLTSDCSSIKSSSLASTEVITPEVSRNEPKLKPKSAISLLPTSQDLSLHKPTDSKKISLDLSLCTITTPESSQTDSDDVSPQIYRRRKAGHGRDILPKFSISVEDEHSGLDPGTSSSENRELSPLRKVQLPNPQPVKHKSRSVVKSASASGLSLMIPSDEFQTPPCNVASPSGGGSSTASSRDTSPCRELSPLVTSLKPPIIIRRGPKGFGFTVHTIRVYYGDTDVYTMHHLVMAVDEGSPAFEAGLRPADLITHINGEAVQGLYHTQVLQLLLGGAEHVSLRATPLEQTSIKTGGRKREPGQSKLAKRSLNRQKKQKRDSDKRRKTSLFRRISSKRASVEMQQVCRRLRYLILIMYGCCTSPVSVTPSRSFQSFPRSDSSLSTSTVRSVAGNRSSLSPSDSFSQHSGNSTPVSTSSGTPSPTSGPNGRGNKQHYQRPSTLHGLKHKLHSTGCSKTLHSSGPSCPSAVPNRRKSVGHIPLSPLARTPSPSPLPASPTRSPSPLAFPIGHQPAFSGCIVLEHVVGFNNY